ncbi:MAG TPA: carboxymuconolactone decarboxylase family protein [Acidimicrobiales bacterium]|nr:carboxymuconolactone decarboxylase family protein [Acidimicrobiales bacterium]
MTSREGGAMGSDSRDDPGSGTGASGTESSATGDGDTGTGHIWEGNAPGSRARAIQIYREVMTVEPDEATSPYAQSTLDFVFGRVWSRDGLSRRDRRWITLACVAAADSIGPINAHVYAALNSGDIAIAEMLEFVLHFAVYCGWPKGSAVEGVIRQQWARIQRERGEETAPLASLTIDSLGPGDPEERVSGGEEAFREVNLIRAPERDTPYTQAGILNFVFGHVWQRPGLSRRDRRLITVACVGIDDSVMPIRSHVGSALQSGDISLGEMREVALQFSAYYGFAKGEFLSQVAEETWDRLVDEGLEPSPPS